MRLFAAVAFVLALSAMTLADGVPTKVTYVPHDKAASGKLPCPRIAGKSRKLKPASRVDKRRGGRLNCAP